MSEMTREEALQIIYDRCQHCDETEKALEILKENKGEWIDNGNGSYTCSNCKTEWTTSQIEKMCFCPTCGADMRDPKGEKGTE